MPSGVYEFHYNGSHMRNFVVRNFGERGTTVGAPGQTTSAAKMERGKTCGKISAGGSDRDPRDNANGRRGRVWAPVKKFCRAAAARADRLKNLYTKSERTDSQLQSDLGFVWEGQSPNNDTKTYATYSGPGNLYRLPLPRPLPSSTDNDKKLRIWQKARGFVLEETGHVSG